MALFVYYQNSNTSRPEGKKVSSLQAKVWCWQLCCDLGWHWMGRRFIQSSTTSQEGSYPGLATVVMHMGRLNWFRLMQRSLVPLEPLTWARTHGKRGLHARFKSLRFEDDAQSHRKVYNWFAGHKSQDIKSHHEKLMFCKSLKLISILLNPSFHIPLQFLVQL